MTIEILLQTLKIAINEFFKMFDTCVININSEIGISLSELVIGGIVAVVIIRVACAFAFRN